jgi:hypothetical protein
MRDTKTSHTPTALALVVFLGGFVLSADAVGTTFLPSDSQYGPAVTFQIAVGDLDGDGDLDAVLANQNATPSRVLLNDGTGRFAYTEQLLTPQGHGVALGDLDGDGDLDAVIACASVVVGGRFSGKESAVYLNDGHAHFTRTIVGGLGDAELSANLVQLADIDHDGDLDAFLAYLTVPGRSFISRVYWNDGTGAFSVSSLDFPFGTLFHDLDGDGDLDAFAKEVDVGYEVWRNDGGGSFISVWRLDDPSVRYEPYCFAFGDLDEDGAPDVVDTNGSWEETGPVYLLTNEGSCTFERTRLEVDDVHAAWPDLADLDLDGHLDASVTIVGEADRVWFGNGQGDLADVGVRLGGDEMTTGHAVGDLDGDGDLDLFIPVYGFRGGPATVWLNQLP